jgi:hypothetical protein
MKLSLRCVIAFLAICMFPFAGFAGETTITLDVKAYIDGRDQLIIKGGTLQWHHFDYAAVGRLFGVNEPTIISTTLNGTPVLTNFDWIPNWPFPPPNEIRFPCFSSTFYGLNPSLPDDTSMTVTLTVIQARGTITIVQSPSASNGETLIVDFNDDPISEAAWYEALLTIETSATDVTPPVVSLAETILGPPKQVVLGTHDTQSGLATLNVLECANCTAINGTFTVGTNDTVDTTATKTNQSESSTIKLEAIDVAGNITIFDPVDFEIQDGGLQRSQTVNISPLEHVVMIANGTPGVRDMEIKVNGRALPLVHVKDGEGKTIDIENLINPVLQNKVDVTAYGPRGGTAWVVITQP